LRRRARLAFSACAVDMKIPARSFPPLIAKNLMSLAASWRLTMSNSAYLAKDP
jgi:hypothetical protein